MYSVFVYSSCNNLNINTFSLLNVYKIHYKNNKITLQNLMQCGSVCITCNTGKLWDLTQTF